MSWAKSHHIYPWRSRLGLHAKKCRNIFIVCVLTWSLSGIKKSFTLQNQSAVKGKSLGFVCSPSFFSLPTASRLSRVGWFSRALAFRSLYNPWEKMGTTRSLPLTSVYIFQCVTPEQDVGEKVSQDQIFKTNHLYCAFHKHTNSKVQKSPSLPSIIITITKDTKRVQIHQSPITNHDLKVFCVVQYKDTIVQEQLHEFRKHHNYRSMFIRHRW